MKKFIILLLLNLLLAFSNQAQQAFDWIKPGNTYYKFEIGWTGVFKIPYQTLVDLGLSSVPGNQFAIYRHGKEQAIYVSTNGILGPNDYIMLPTETNSALEETELFNNPANQLNITKALLTDNATYFLTYDNGTHLRYTLTPNNYPNPLPPPAPYCWAHEYSNIPFSVKNLGTSYATTERYYSAEFDKLEGMVQTGTFNQTKFMLFKFPNPLDNSNALVTINLGNLSRTQSLKLNFDFNGKHSFDTTIGPQQSLTKEFVIPESVLSAAFNNPYIFINNNGTEMAIYEANIKIQKKYNFSDGMDFYGKFKTSKDYPYLNLLGVAGNVTDTVFVFDKTNNNLHQATYLAWTHKAVFLKPSTKDYDIQYCWQPSIATLQKANFSSIGNINTSILSNQGNYIILSHDSLINQPQSNITAYAQYRASIAGGNLSPVIVSVNQLYNLFGYGQEFNPLAIKRFIKYAQDNWSVKPTYLFIIGKGLLYTDYSYYKANQQNYTFYPIPTWGHPGTDNLFSSFGGKTIPTLATGRLTAFNNDEIGLYLDKVKAYESAILPAFNFKDDIWKKQVLHVAGATSHSIQSILIATLQDAQKILEDTLIGANVSTIYKKDTDPVTNIVNASIDSLIDNGLKYITFYGHAGSSGFDYNLNAPHNQKSKPRFPIFMAYGCDVGQIFLNANTKSVTEDYILSPTGGAIAMISSNNLGWTGTIPNHMKNLYRNFAVNSYESTLGMQYLNNIIQLQTNFSDKFTDIHCQSFMLHGDPGIQNLNPLKPDYAIDNSLVSTQDPNVNITMDSFGLQIIPYNVGKAIKDSIAISFEMKKIGDNTLLHADTIYRQINYNDTIIVQIPIDPNKNIGLNIIKVTLDPANEVDELAEHNNSATIEIFIQSDNIFPVYPAEFAIVNKDKITLKASTLNPFSISRKYKFEIDTTLLFNSNIKQQQDIVSSGGTLSWTPGIILQDSVVYYWRTTADTLINNDYKWNTSSFIYLAQANEGWNQSHIFQYQRNTFKGLEYNAIDRNFEFKEYTNKFYSQNAVINGATNRYKDISEILNDKILNNSNCYLSKSIQISVFDGISGEPKARTFPCGNGNLTSANEFDFTVISQRKEVMDFLNNVQNGDYISIKNYTYYGLYGGINAVSWQSDTLTYGAGNSLYHLFKDYGFTKIDSLNGDYKTFVLFFRKGDPNYPVQQAVSIGHELISINANFISNPDTGIMYSTLIGPASKWEQLIWDYNAKDNLVQNDYPYVSIYGIDNNNDETFIQHVTAKDTSLSFIDAAQYNKLKLYWNSADSITSTSANLKHWRVHYTPVPEAALAPNIYLSYKDTLDQGENAIFKLAVANISNKNMDSLLVKYRIIDQNNVSKDINELRYKPLPAGDTLHASIQINMQDYPGKNYLFIEANPHNDQPELYHPNNLGYLPLFVNIDKRNPLLDVTFDGVRILDKDIVSGKPFIKILLNDENKTLPLNDTSLFEIQLAKPSTFANPEKIAIDGAICKFIPANISANNKNEAYIEFRPTLLEDGLYKLTVKAKDKSGNIAGNASTYDVQFTVENKATITNVLNYPNPFSTHTSFIFTLTGSQLPSQFKIQILSVTGKVVKEITKNELGNIHIGRNITEYKWDGRDQYGQLLGNGVYLYRVVSSLNGEQIEHRKNEKVDDYFKNGYGKLYIMR